MARTVSEILISRISHPSTEKTASVERIVLASSAFLYSTETLGLPPSYRLLDQGLNHLGGYDGRRKTAP